MNIKIIGLVVLNLSHHFSNKEIAERNVLFSKWYQDSSPYRSASEKADRRAIHFWPYYREFISTGHFCSEEIRLLLFTLFLQDLASTCYKQHTSLSMFLLKVLFPKTRVRVLWFLLLWALLRGEVITWNLFVGLCVCLFYMLD